MKTHIMLSTISVLLFALPGCGGGGGGNTQPASVVPPPVAVPLPAQPVTAQLALKVTNKTVYEFYSTEKTPAFEYGGVYNEAGIANFHHTSYATDLFNNGSVDVYASVTKGYASGIDARMKPVIFRNVNGMFEYATPDTALNGPVTGVRRFAEYGQLPGDNERGLFTVSHDNGDGLYGDANIVVSDAVPYFDNARAGDALPLDIISRRKHTVNAHAMAGGDLNGNNRSDFFVADWGDCNETFSVCANRSYFLIQQSNGQWNLEFNEFLDTINFYDYSNELDDFVYSSVLDAHIADLNNDGFGDLVIGAVISNPDRGSSCVYFSQGADGNGVPTYSQDSKWCVEEADLPFGAENSLPLKTWSGDITGNGYNDIIIVYSQQEPYYRDYKFVVIENNNGVLSVNNSIMQDLNTVVANDNAWSDQFDLTDVNGDGALDFIGTANGYMRLWLNNNRGGLTEISVAKDFNLVSLEGSQWKDLGNGRFGSVVMNSECTKSSNNECTELRVFFSQIELNREILTLDKEVAVNN